MASPVRQLEALLTVRRLLDDCRASLRQATGHLTTAARGLGPQDAGLYHAVRELVDAVSSLERAATAATQAATSRNLDQD